MRAKLIILLLSSFVLFSCSKASETLGSTLKTNELSGYQIGIPENWTILKTNDASIPKPKSGTVTLAAHSNELEYGFSNSILVLSQDLNKEITSNDFSILNNVGASKEYDEYQKIDSKTIKFSDGDESTLYTFEAKYNLNTKKLKFMQIGKVCNFKKGNLITVALPTSVKITSLYENIIQSFKCK